MALRSPFTRTKISHYFLTQRHRGTERGLIRSGVENRNRNRYSLINLYFKKSHAIHT